MQSIFRDLPSAPSQQRGMATILIIMLMGLALTVTASGVMYSVRTSQEQQVTVHAATHSQAGVWAAAEAVRSYLETLDVGAVKGLERASTLSFYINTNKVTAKLSPLLINDTTPNHLYAEINYTDTAAKASSTLEVVYSFIATTKDTGPSNHIASFGGDTTISGGVNIDVDPGKTYNIVVDGNLKLGGGLTGKGSGINSIESTKSIEISGGATGSFLEKIHANCDIKLTGSATIASAIYAGRNICLGNNSTPPAGKSNLEVKANGSVDSSNSHPWGHILALAGVTEKNICTATSYSSLCNPSTKGVTLSNGSSKAEKITTHGSVEINTSTNSIEILADNAKPIPDNNNLNITSNHFPTGKVRQQCTPKEKCDGITSEISAPFLTPISPVPEVIITKQTLNVEDLEVYANYIFEYDGSKEYLVHVKNIGDRSSGVKIEDGRYRLTNTEPIKNLLCSEVTPKSCFGPIAIGNGTGDTNAISYTYPTWTVTKELTPGFIIFKGNLKINSGTNLANTLAATGNIETTGSTKLYSLNYAGYDGTRLQDGKTIIYAPKDSDNNQGMGVCKHPSFNYYPTNLCDINSEKFNFQAIDSYGNYGLLASGNIIVSHEIFGSVKAGGAVTTGGTPIVHGFVSGLGTSGHSLKNFTIKLNSFPTGYDPGSAGNSNGGGGSSELKAIILWSRYL